MLDEIIACRGVVICFGASDSGRSVNCSGCCGGGGNGIRKRKWENGRMGATVCIGFLWHRRYRVHNL